MPLLVELQQYLKSCELSHSDQAKFHGVISDLILLFGQDATEFTTLDIFLAFLLAETV